MTQVSFLGSATLNALQKQNAQPKKQKLAQVVAQKADDRYNQIYNTTTEFLIANITENAIDRSYTFDLKKFIGDKFKIECPESLYSEIESWLNDEGFTFDTQRNRNTRDINTAINMRWAKYHNPIVDTPKNDKRLYSDMTFFIKW